MIPSPSEVGAEEIVGNLVLWLKLAVEAVGGLVIGVGMLLAAGRFNLRTDARLGKSGPFSFSFRTSPGITGRKSFDAAT